MTEYKTTSSGRRRVHKLYVAVVVRHEEGGEVTPLAVCWPDGRTFWVDEVLERGELGAEVRGRRQACYRVRFGTHETELYLERTEARPSIDRDEVNRWWVFAYDRTRPGHAPERQGSPEKD